MSTTSYAASQFESSSRTREAQLEILDWELAKMTVPQRIAKAQEIFAGRTVLASSFKPTGLILLEEVIAIEPEVPIVTIRHGQETPQTIERAEAYGERGLDIHVYQAPSLEMPQEDTPEFAQFQRRVKVETFQRMLDDLQPLAYFSGRMRWQSEGRAELAFVEDKGSVVAINPLADMSKEVVDAFLDLNDLSVDGSYYDPTKGRHQQLECQLNTTTYS